MQSQVDVRTTELAGRSVFALADFAQGQEIQTDSECFALAYMDYCQSGIDKEKNVADLSDAYVLAMHLLLSPEKCREFNDCLQPSNVRSPAGLEAIRSIRALRLAATKDSTFEQLKDVTNQQVALAMAQCRTNFFTCVLSLPDSEIMVFFVLSKKLAMYNHSCEPNCQFQFAYDRNRGVGRGSMVALKPIATGDEILCSYLSPEQLEVDVRQRQAWLKHGWLFDCHCSSCAALVMGSSQSAVRCVTELSLARGQLSAFAAAKRREQADCWRQLLQLTTNGATRSRSAALAHRMSQASADAEHLESLLALLDPLLRAAKSMLHASGSKQPRFSSVVHQAFATVVRSVHAQEWRVTRDALVAATDAMVKSGCMPPTLLRPDTDAEVARILNMAEEHVVSAQLQTMPIAPRSTAADLVPIRSQP